MAADGKDIPLVLVTGAGASRDLGVGGAKLPLMPEWSNHLVNALVDRGGHYRKMTGLEPDIDGLEFETRLGRFLNARVAFTEIREIFDATKTFGGYALPALNDPNTLEQWYSNVESWLNDIDNIIASSLYDLFAVLNVDVGKAATAYGELLTRLGIVHGLGARLVIATTNYDPIAELALVRLGYRVQWGETVQPDGGNSPVQVDGLTNGIGAYVPLLHLHGRVGWYRREDGHAYAASGAKAHNQGFGTPIVMLPNLEKEYAEDDVIDLLWRQFGSVLECAEKVLVLGHGLNDPALVSILREKVQPPHRLAVTVYGHRADPGAPDAPGDQVLKRLADDLPGAKVIPMRFGDDTWPRGKVVEDWLSRIGAG